MASSRSANTMPESLVKMLADISNLKTLPDADVAWIIDNLETPVLKKIREPLEQMYANGSSQVPPMDPGMGGGMGMPPGQLGPAMGMPQQTPSAMPGPPPGVGGLRQSPDMGVAVDELRRVMSGAR